MPLIGTVGSVPTIVASVASNALTVALKTLSGSDPSPSDPVTITFRDQDLTTGGVTSRSISSALNLTVPAGAGSGILNNSVPFRLWWVAFDDGGQVRLAFIRCQSDPSIFALPEHGVSSANNISGGTGPGIGVFYSDAAIVSKAFRIIGYTEWLAGLANVALWDIPPTTVQLFGPGIKKPGDLVASYGNSFAGTASGVVSIPYDNTPPQDNEGASSLSLTITPKSPANSMRFTATHTLARSTAGPLIMALFRSTIADCRRVVVASANADVPHTLYADRTEPIGTASSITYTVRYGGTAGATVYLNSNSGGALFGSGYLGTAMTLDELMG